MISVAKAQRRNAWRNYVRGVAFGDGRRPARRPLKGAQEKAGLPPGVWTGRGLSALGLTAGGGGDAAADGAGLRAGSASGHRPDPARTPGPRRRCGDGTAGHRSRVAGWGDREAGADPLLAVDFVFRAQASLIVLWALGDDHTRRVIDLAHERAIETVRRRVPAARGVVPVTESRRPSGAPAHGSFPAASRTRSAPRGAAAGNEWTR
ncbi:relaxase domain-containing protein [Streptomyces sp. NPDC093982]|uniref:relaxase domain-containing protein n=1 Tax=Streptomyces sp. NPDC093982 TaxID=3155077 RepID=UPI003426F374